MLFDEELKVQVGRIEGGSFVRVTHLPTGRQRTFGPFGDEDPASLILRLRTEIEDDLRDAGLMQYVLDPDWKTLAEFERNDLFADTAVGDWRPMNAMLGALRKHSHADRLSAFTSHRKLVVTPAIGYADRIRSDSVTIEYRPTDQTFLISYLRPFPPTVADSSRHSLTWAPAVAMRLLDRLVSDSEAKTVKPQGTG